MAATPAATLLVRRAPRRTEQGILCSLDLLISPLMDARGTGGGWSLPRARVSERLRPCLLVGAILGANNGAKTDEAPHFDALVQSSTDICADDYGHRQVSSRMYHSVVTASTSYGMPDASLIATRPMSVD